MNRSVTQFAGEVRAGLSKPKKELPSKYLYDELGSALFDAITALPEYGLTRADSRILHRRAPELPREFSCVAEFGSGSGAKTRPVLSALTPEKYFPIDVSHAALEHCRRELCGLADIQPIEASYLDGMDQVNRQRNGDPMLLLFLGSSIGNFDSPCREVFLGQVRARLKPGDAMLIGFDLIKDTETMIEAYDDPTGVTGAFNLNLLGRINRELGADFEIRAFAHQAIYNEDERRIEMHLRARVDQCVKVAAAGFHCSFRADETIWTESSHKFEADEIPDMARAAGFVSEAQWIDEEWPFEESLWRAL